MNKNSDNYGYPERNTLIGNFIFTIFIIALYIINYDDLNNLETIGMFLVLFLYICRNRINDYLINKRRSN